MLLDRVQKRWKRKRTLQEANLLELSLGIRAFDYPFCHVMRLKTGGGAIRRFCGKSP
jgi:hypothetical protein